LGGIILAFTEDNRERQSTTAWRTGSNGEQTVGQRLDTWAISIGGYVLHDRRIPGTRANIDHIAVAPSGIWAVDAKKYKGQVEHVDKGGWFKTDLRLKVGGRDQTKLVSGVLGQMERLRVAVDTRTDSHQPPEVHGMLCFVEAEWRLFPKPFTHDGVIICWPAALAKLLNQSGPLGPVVMAELARRIIQAFPEA